jgi:hypothetical protein
MESLDDRHNLGAEVSSVSKDSTVNRPPVTGHPSEKAEPSGDAGDLSRSMWVLQPVDRHTFVLIWVPQGFTVKQGIVPVDSLSPQLDDSAPAHNRVRAGIGRFLGEIDSEQVELITPSLPAPKLFFSKHESAQRAILWDAQLIGKQQLGSKLCEMATAAGAGAGLHPWGWADKTRHAFNSFESLAIAPARHSAGLLHGRISSLDRHLPAGTGPDQRVRTAQVYQEIPHGHGLNGIRPHAIDRTLGPVGSASSSAP